MRPRPMFLLSLAFAATAAMAQTATNSPSSQTGNPASAPAPKPVTAPASSSAPLVGSPGMLHQANPAAAAVPARSEAGATERGLNPTGAAGAAASTDGAATGVTQRVQRANAHGVDAQGHTLDAHGKPVGQAAVPMPAPATTVR